MNSASRLEIMQMLLNHSKFAELKTNQDRVAFLLDNVLNYDMAKQMVKENLEKARQKSMKNVHLAKSYLDEAELFFKSIKLDSAMEAVHKAILLVPSGEIGLRSKMYMVKSNIHFTKKEYQAALYAVELALQIKGSFDLELVMLKMNCLITLRLFCSAIMLIDQVLGQSEPINGCQDIDVYTFESIKQKLQNDGYIKDFGHDLKAERNQRRKYFSYRMDNRCKIECSDVVGRHFVATENIPEKTVLLEERPYSLVLESSYFDQKCNSCYHDLKHKFFPCAFCIEVVFCDETCFRQGWQRYHRFECGQALAIRELSAPVVHVFSMISRVGPLQAYDLAATKADYSVELYLDESRQRDIPELEKNVEERYRAYKMASILCDHNEKIHCIQTNVYHTVLALETAILLDLVHDFRKIQPDHQFLLRFISMIIVDIRRVVFNASFIIEIMKL